MSDEHQWQMDQIRKACKDEFYEMSNPELADEYVAELGDEYSLLNSISRIGPVENQIIYKKINLDKVLDAVNERIENQQAWLDKHQAVINSVARKLVGIYHLRTVKESEKTA